METTSNIKTNSALKTFGSIFFIINLLLLVFLLFFEMIEKLDFLPIVVILLIEALATIVGCYWYSYSEKTNQGTILPLLVIVISMFFTYQMFSQLKETKNPYHVDGKMVSGFD